jgi:hypothetical protein
MPSDRRSGVPVSLTLAVVTATILSGCGAFRVYDETRAKQAAGIKERYTKADVLGTLDVEKKNLDALLGEELKVVRDNQRLRLDYALLRIAADPTPMADTYIEKATPRIAELGFTDVRSLRAERFAAVDLAVGLRRLLSLDGSIRSLAGTPPPPCTPGTPAPPTMDMSRASDRVSAEGLYGLYRKACDELKPLAHSGLLASARSEWMQARAETAMLDQSAQEARKIVAARTKAYEEALALQKAAADQSEAVKNRLQQAADSALKALNLAKDAVKTVETKSTATENVDALVTVLTAAAGGTVTTKDENVRKAATIAKEIPSLAGDMTALLEQDKAPSVSGLLIEMRHQTLILEHVKQLRTFAQERTDILKARYDALQEESRLWLRFSDAVCSYAALKAGQPFPGSKCDNFDVKLVAAAGTAPAGADCTLDRAGLRPCPLSRSWNESIRDRSNVGATREIYKALAAYLQVLGLQSADAENTFRLIDLTHREALADRAVALKEWDNLVAVPVTQLDAYYAAGLKPAEIADLLVKALGFTAIAVGVSR